MDDETNELLHIELSNKHRKEKQLPCHSGSTSTSNTERQGAAKRLKCAAIICVVFMVVELIGGYLAGSLALMSDAAHLITDSITFLIGMFGIKWSNKVADSKMSLGYKRIEVLCAVLSIIGIWILTMFILYFAVERLFYLDSFEIDTDTMLAVSIVGMLVNIVMASILHGGFFSICSHSHSHGHAHNHNDLFDSSSKNYDLLPKIRRFSSEVSDLSDHEQYLENRNLHTSNPFKNPVHQYQIDNGRNQTSNSNNSRFDQNELDDNHLIIDDCEKEIKNSKQEISRNINIQAAFLHVLGDFLQSVGVIIAAIIIKFYPHAKVVDPLCTFLFSIIVISTTFKMFKESTRVLLEGVPTSISYEDILKDLKDIGDVRSVHDLNVWSLSTDYHIATVHLCVEDKADHYKILDAATKVFSSHDINRSTVQIESEKIFDED